MDHPLRYVGLKGKAGLPQATVTVDDWAGSFGVQGLGQCNDLHRSIREEGWIVELRPRMEDIAKNGLPRKHVPLSGISRRGSGAVFRLDREVVFELLW